MILNSPPKALQPIPWQPIAFIPRADASELPADSAWQQWDQAVASLEQPDLKLDAS